MASGVPASDKRGSSFFVLQYTRGRGFSRRRAAHRACGAAAASSSRHRTSCFLTVAPGQARGAS